MKGLFKFASSSISANGRFWSRLDVWLVVIYLLSALSIFYAVFFSNDMQQTLFLILGAVGFLIVLSFTFPPHDNSTKLSLSNIWDAALNVLFWGCFFCIMMFVDSDRKVVYLLCCGVVFVLLFFVLDRRSRLEKRNKSKGKSKGSP